MKQSRSIKDTHVILIMQLATMDMKDKYPSRRFEGGGFSQG
jgi:hypothetical protein